MDFAVGETKKGTVAKQSNECDIQRLPCGGLCSGKWVPKKANHAAG
jgi:hypothetical protein